MYRKQSALLSGPGGLEGPGLGWTRPVQGEGGQGPRDHLIPHPAEPSPLHLPSPWFSDPCCIYHFNKTHPTSLGEFVLAGHYGSGGDVRAPWVWPRVCSGPERAHWVLPELTLLWRERAGAETHSGSPFLQHRGLKCPIKFIPVLRPGQEGALTATGD